jgi:hypothetical protein
MLRLRVSLLLLLALLIVTPAWGNHDCQPNVFTTTLFAGQTIDAGDVIAQIVGDQLCVTYDAHGDWVIEEVHLAIGSSLADIPQTKKGNPRPGQFPLKATYQPGVSTATLCTPFTGGFDEVFVAAHAVVTGAPGGAYSGQEETGWGDGFDFPGSNWATYFRFVPLICTPHE